MVNLSCAFEFAFNQNSLKEEQEIRLKAVPVLIDVGLNLVNLVNTWL